VQHKRGYHPAAFLDEQLIRLLHQLTVTNTGANILDPRNDSISFYLRLRLSVKHNMLILLFDFMISLSTDHLRAFIAVFEENGFSNAAIKLHLSQSAVSTQVRLLEERIGLTLFDRSKRPSKLTEIGRTVLDFGKQLVNTTGDLERYLQEFSSGISGEVKIGAISSISSYLLIPIVFRLLQDSPKLKISILTQSRSLLYDAVRQSGVDFAIVLSDEKPENLHVKVIRSERLCFAVSSKNYLRSKKDLTIRDLKTALFVHSLQGRNYTKMVERLLEGVGLKDVNVAMRVSNWESIQEAVRAGIGIAVLPDFVIERDRKQRSISELPVKGVNLRADIMLLEHPNRHFVSPSVTFVKDALLSALRV
jgi:DNA-binding transcriptional LysR family regulator